MMKYQSLARALHAFIRRKGSIVILMHQRPDGDAIGAALALAQWCRAHGNHVQLISPTPYPKFLAWMPGRKKIIVAEQNQDYAEKLIKNAPLLICVDLASGKRLGRLSKVVQGAPGEKIAIDHHLDPGSFWDLLISDPHAASTTMLLYDLICAVDETHMIDAVMATSLYVGLVTDTGNFMHENTTARAHEVAAALVGKGVNVSEVANCLYGNQTLNKVHFLGHVLTHRLVVMPDYPVAYMVVPSEDAKRFHLQAGDTLGLVQYVQNLEGIEFSALITEQEDAKEVRLSFRSRGDLAVDGWAKKYFNGGGHKNAAGGVSYTSLEETVAKFEAMVREEFTKR